MCITGLLRFVIFDLFYIKSVENKLNLGAVLWFGLSPLMSSLFLKGLAASHLLHLLQVHFSCLSQTKKNSHYLFTMVFYSQTLRTTNEPLLMSPLLLHPSAPVMAISSPVLVCANIVVTRRFTYCNNVPWNVPGCCDNLISLRGLTLI